RFRPGVGSATPNPTAVVCREKLYRRLQLRLRQKYELARWPLRRPQWKWPRSFLLGQLNGSRQPQAETASREQVAFTIGMSYRYHTPTTRQPNRISPNLFQSSRFAPST